MYQFKSWLKSRPLCLQAVAVTLMLAADAASAQSPFPFPFPAQRWGDDPSGPPPRYLRPWRGPFEGDEPPAWRAPRDWREPNPDGQRSPPQQGRRPVMPDDEEAPPTRRQRAGDPDVPQGQKVMDGGPQPEIRPLPPQRVLFSGGHAPGTIIIETSGRQLLLVVSGREALRYPISVGREGFAWTGTEKISRIADWPDWHPPEQMRERDPKLPEKMTGGLRNPLGAKALYLGDTLYRIHGTNDAKSIGHASSSGCFRMLNGHVIDLAGRVRVGAAVVVADRLPREVVSPAFDPEQRPRYRY